MHSLHIREYRLVITALAVLGAILLYEYGVSPRCTRFMELHKQMKEVDTNLSEIRTLIAHREEIQSQSEKLYQQIQSPENQDTGWKALFEEIQRLAESAHLINLSLHPQKIREMGFYRLLGVEMSAEGSIRSAAKFLHSLGESPQLLRTDQIQSCALPKTDQLHCEFTIVKIITVRGVS